MATGTVASAEAAHDAHHPITDEAFNTRALLERDAYDAAASALSSHLPPLSNYV